MRSALFAALIMSVIPVGCAGNKRESLGEALRVFNDGVRWQRVDWSIGYVPKKKQPQYLARRAKRAGIRVTGYTLQSVQVEGSKAKAFVQIQWYSETRLRVLVTVVEQDWRFGENGWQVVEEHRIGGEPCPLVGRRSTEAPNERLRFGRSSGNAFFAPTV